MVTDNLSAVFEQATGGKQEVPVEWLPAGRVRPLIFGDPGELWLEFFGTQHGLAPDDSPYELLDFIGQKTRQFQAKWIEQAAPQAVWVCQEPYQAGLAEMVQQTLTLMAAEAPVIAKPALWWAPERVYASPDLIVHSDWLSHKFPAWLASPPSSEAHYLPVLIRFTTRLEEREKEEDLNNYQVQGRLAAYILGQMQGVMPHLAFIVARDRVFDPLPVAVAPRAGQPLDPDLAALREQYADIRRNGDRLLPWRDERVAVNLDEQSGRWRTAKEIIARQKVPGGDPSVVYFINNHVKAELAQQGLTSLQALLEADPALEQLKELKLGPNGPRLGEKRAGRIKAILQANCSGQPVNPPAQAIPARRQLEFTVKFLHFSNLNVDFERQWPGLEGLEMVFMIGVGWEEGGEFRRQSWRAAAENLEAEKALLDQFSAFLELKAGAGLTDPAQTALYHWSGSYKSQAEKAATRQGLPASHPLFHLPWVDLRAAVMEAPAAVPGAWGFGLKPLAKALARLDARYDPKWVGDLADSNDGQRAVVLAWQMYQRLRDREKNQAAEGFSILEDYLAADTRAVWQVLRWLRAPAAPPSPAPAPARVEEMSRMALESLAMPAPKRRYAALNQGKGIQLYLQPQPGKKVGKEAINHLIWGDWLEVVETEGPWLKVQARGSTGWVHQDFVTDEPLLEINFVDVGQGDGAFIVTPQEQYLLVDAGLADNMYRFLRWRFNHFKQPVRFSAMVITHSDKDHYAGFQNFFNPKDPILKNLHVERVYHNGIIERSGKDLGPLMKDPASGVKYLTDIIVDRPSLQRVLQATANPGQYLGLMKRMLKSGRVDDVRMLAAKKDGIHHMDGFGPGQDLRIEVLAPVPEVFDGQVRLRWFEDQGKTKNGHSVVLRLVYRNVSILLGGDLNIPAEKYLLEHYERLGLTEGSPDSLTRHRKFLQVDAAKACHHGSADFTSDFLMALNPLATVISSGDEESHSHPRPESLGALGHFSRIDRPLIFSTELARSAPEKVKHPNDLKKELEKARQKERVAEYAEELIVRLGRSISVYGMITLRTDGRRMLFAQKLERARSPGQKWDQYLLEPDQNGILTYQSKHDDEE